MNQMISLVYPEGDLLKKVQKAYNEDERTKDEDLRTLIDWLQKQPHLPNQWDENKLRNYLRGCHYSFERCKRKLDRYFTMRALAPEFFTNRDINCPEMVEIRKFAKATILPQLTPEGKRIVLFTTNDNFRAPNFFEILKIVLMTVEIVLEIEEKGTPGYILVIDAKHVLAKNLYTLSPIHAKKFATIMRCYPIKIEEIHFVNLTSILDAIIVSIKPFINDSIYKNLNFHRNIASLHKKIPKHLLTTEFGGTCGCIEDTMVQWINTLDYYKDWFKKEENIKADESRRLGAPKRHDQVFGIQGSFRQLAID